MCLRIPTQNVSVPLRGYGFEILKKDLLCSQVEQFPSPCGDMVLKFSAYCRNMNMQKEFPSPCGDMVLKLYHADYQCDTPHQVSVPLRGYGFESCGIRGWAHPRLVSVPLRGYGFEITFWCTMHRRKRLFPSPCGDMVLKKNFSKTYSCFF